MISFSSNYYESSSSFHGSIPGIMGTRFDVLIAKTTKEKALLVWNKIVAELIRLHKMMNRFDSKSELSRINMGAKKDFVTVSDEMWSVLNDCKHYHSISEGLFDITVNNLSKVAFEIESKSVAFPNKDFYFDLGGYAKGYAIEKIKKCFRKQRWSMLFLILEIVPLQQLGIIHLVIAGAFQLTIRSKKGRC